MKIRYKRAPLPFQGQKRKLLTPFAEEIKKLPDNVIYIDLFGGSGLLSRTIKDIKPNSRVIYNDFDNYIGRLQIIKQTNALLAGLRPIVLGVPKETRLSAEKKEAIMKIVGQYDKQGVVDYTTISSALLFSMNYALSFEELAKSTLYNNIPLNDYSDATGYLDGLEVRRCDYRELLDEFKDDYNALFICDPPYLSTDAATYNGYWKLRDYLNVMNCLKDTNFVFFTSNKSALIELLQWLKDTFEIANPFDSARVVEINTTVNFCSKYTDIMIFNANRSDFE